MPSSVSISAGGRSSEIRTTSTAGTDAAAANRSYATSHIAVQYIIATWGPDAITDLVREFRQGVTADEALTAALGVGTEGLDAQFRAWLAQQSE